MILVLIVLAQLLSVWNVQNLIAPTILIGVTLGALHAHFMSLCACARPTEAMVRAGGPI